MASFSDFLQFVVPILKVLVIIESSYDRKHARVESVYHTTSLFSLKDDKGNMWINRTKIPKNPFMYNLLAVDIAELLLVSRVHLILNVNASFNNIQQSFFCL